MKLKTSISLFLFAGWFFLPCRAQDTAFISMTGDCRYPAVAAEGNTVCLAWIVSEGRNAAIYFRNSMDEGNQWSSARKISNERGDCFPPAVAVNAGVVHLVWMDYGETVDGEIYYARSLDMGETWEKNRVIENNANSARYPLIACRKNSIYLIWQDVENKVYFKASHNQGLTWGKEMLLGKVGKHSCYCYPPAIACKGSELTVVWTDFSDDKRGLSVLFSGLPLVKTGDQMISAVVCRGSTDNGHTWNKAKVLSATPLSKETKEEIDNPIMISNDSLYYLFWLDKRNTMLGEIFYSRFDSKTARFPIACRNLYPEKRSPKRPTVAFDKEGNCHLTWASFFNGESVISYGEIDPAGNALKEKKDIIASRGHYFCPIITRTASGRLHIIWFDQPEDKTRWSRIFLKTSSDNGATWDYWGPHKQER